jgi:multicomponent K+:H+ antiporter subunit A
MTMTVWLVIPLLTIGLAALLTFLLFRRTSSTLRMSWLMAFFPELAFGVLLWLSSQITPDKPITLQVEWLPSLGLSLSLYLDNLSALFALMVTGIGTLVVIYTGYYFQKDTTTWRFLAYLLLFMASMLGLVIAGDVITLFIFWEATSITSFLLISYKTKSEEARQGAFKALFVTGGGGIALLAGLIWIASIAGGTDFPTILASGTALRASPYYPVILGLVALGAFTKSAQTPAHIWLPSAMTAPTPASAFLHSATMVKAGVYLLARLNPSLGYTDLWFYLLTSVGIITMLSGAYLGFKQNDLKALLAYSTISQLGVMVAMIGQDIEIAYKALVISIVAHSLYKSALFMIAGIVDHETGTRDLRRLGGLARLMPATTAVATIAGLSMAGLPPMFGFLAKETLLATSVHPSLPPFIGALFPWAAVAAGALLLAQSGLFVYDTFLGKPADPHHPAKGHEPPTGMWLMPAIPAILTLAIGLLPEPERLASFLAGAAADAYGSQVKISLALWTGLSVPLALSVVAILTGSVLFVFRHRLRPFMQNLLPAFDVNTVYSAVLFGIDRGATWVTRLQIGQLRFYLAIMLTSVGGLILLFQAIPLSYLDDLLPSMPAVPGRLDLLRLSTLGLAVLSSLITIYLRRDLYSILALSVSGLAVAVWFALEPAPDVALVQIVVDLLATVILVLSLSRLPRVQREKARELTFRQSRPGLFRDGLIALGSGLVVAILVYVSLSTRPHTSLVSPFYAEYAKLLTGAKDIVGAILVDFRSFDTLFEIMVFAAAGLGIQTLLHYAARKAGDQEEPDPQPPGPGEHPALGVGGLPTSSLLHLLAYSLLPLALLLAAIEMMYGHDQPGDGFTAGIVISLAIGFWYVIFGYHSTKKQLPWLRSGYLIAAGILIGLFDGLLSALLGTSFLSPVDYGSMLNLPLPAGFNLSNSFFFEVAICLTVLGSATYILDNLGRPKEADPESDALLRTFEGEPTPKSTRRSS